MRASEVMITDVIVAAAGATSSEVAALMRVKNISVVPVVDNPKDRHYMGTISDRDIVARCVGAGHDPTDCSVADHARTDTPIVEPETELARFQGREAARSNGSSCQIDDCGVEWRQESRGVHLAA
jgi:CBS domain-containing protein